MKWHWRIIFLIIVLGPTALRGQDPLLDLLREPETGVDVICKLGGEADSDNGRLAEGNLHWRPSRHVQLSTGYTYSTLATTNATQTSTRILSFAGEYNFGPLGLGGGFDHVSESELLTSNTFSLKPLFESGAWRLEINASRRVTDFDPFGFQNVAIKGPNGMILRVSGSADLSLTNTGLGGVVDYQGETLHAYASYDSFSYGEYEGATSLTAIRNAQGSISATMFNALAARMVTRLQRFAGSRATVKAGLLDYATTAGLDVTLRRFRFGLEASRNRDHLTENRSDSLTGFLALDTSRRTTLELRGGATQSDQLGTIRFIGLNLVLRSLPKITFS